MTELVVKIVIFSVAASFLIICLLWKKPVSDGGKLSLKLCVVNALGWFCILPLSDRGHPPPILFPLLFFWLINLPLLPAAVVALWGCYKGREERVPYLAIASAYVLMNILVLFILPLALLIREARR
jgi:hypothetical protein